MPKFKASPPQLSNATIVRGRTATHKPQLHVLPFTPKATRGDSQTVRDLRRLEQLAPEDAEALGQVIIDLLAVVEPRPVSGGDR